MLKDLRRHIMMQQKADEGYIQNGLVFHLDGIDKGQNIGSWTDLIGGVEYVNHGAILNNDNIEFLGNTSSYMMISENNSNPNISALVGTIEVVFDADTNGYIFSTGVPGSIVFSLGVVNQCNQFYSIQFGYPSNYKAFNFDGLGKHIYSLNYEHGVGDIHNILTPVNTQLGASSINYSLLGARSWADNVPYPTFYWKGKLYSVRIYNRHLTIEEMLHNQQIDNVRFNLGLNL